MNEHQQLAIKILRESKFTDGESAKNAAISYGQGKPPLRWWEEENARIDAAIVWLTSI
uniref:Uncharacterized protein n=1 Tax=viral metagenome TaxID=1070528 RepID=A0A6M3KH66_9ZZZZ